MVIPCLNEQAHIENVLRGLAAEAHRTPMQIVVADGGGADGSRAVVEHIAAHDARVVLLDNPKRIQSAGVNLAARLHGEGCASCFGRRRAHYPTRFCERLLAVQAKTGADSVVVAMRTVGRTCFERAAAAAQNSLLGNGGSAHRNRGAGRWVDHGNHALFASQPFSAVDGYDETFSHNEDVDSTFGCANATFASISQADCRSNISRAPIRSPCSCNTAASATGAPATCSSTRGTPSRATSSWHRSRRSCFSPCWRPSRWLSRRPPSPGRLLPRLRGDDRRQTARSLRSRRGIAAIATQAGWSFWFLAGVAQGLRNLAAARRWRPAPTILKETGDERPA